MQNSKNDEERADTKTLIITCGMIVMLCGLFFVLGYGYNQKAKVEQANKAILEFQEEFVCSPKPMGGIFDEEGQYTISDINITWD